MATQFVNVTDYATKSPQTSKVDLPLVTQEVAVYIPKMSFYLKIAVPNASTNFTVAAPCALEVIGVKTIKSGVISANVGDTVKATANSVDLFAAIPQNVAVGVSQVAQLTVGTDTSRLVAKGALITIDPTLTATSCACDLYLECIAQ